MNYPSDKNALNKDLLILITFIFIFSIIYFAKINDISSITGRVVNISLNSCTDDTKVVYRMNSFENAHAAFPNTPDISIYNIEVCWQDAIDRSTTCRDSNRNPIDPEDERQQPINAVLRLSGTDNAHVERWNLQTRTDGYRFLCYDDLRCDYTLNTGNANDCNTIGQGYECFGTMSSNTNAHVGDCRSPPNFYPTKICCKPGCTINRAVWTDLNDVPITESVAEGILVYLRIEGDDGCYGKFVNTTIYEDDLIIDTEIENLTDINFTTRQAQIAVARQIWRARWMDDGFLQGDPEYYFLANTTLTPSVRSVNNLEVFQTGRRCGNEIVEPTEVCEFGPDSIPGTNDDRLPQDAFRCTNHSTWTGNPNQRQRLFCGSNCLVIDTTGCICASCRIGGNI